MEYLVAAGIIKTVCKILKPTLWVSACTTVTVSFTAWYKSSRAKRVNVQQLDMGCCLHHCPTALCAADWVRSKCHAADRIFPCIPSRLLPFQVDKACAKVVKGEQGMCRGSAWDMSEVVSERATGFRRYGMCMGTAQWVYRTSHG